MRAAPTRANRPRTLPPIRNRCDKFTSRCRRSRAEGARGRERPSGGVCPVGRPYRSTAWCALPHVAILAALKHEPPTPERPEGRPRANRAARRARPSLERIDATAAIPCVRLDHPRAERDAATALWAPVSRWRPSPASSGHLNRRSPEGWTSSRRAKGGRPATHRTPLGPRTLRPRRPLRAPPRSTVRRRGGGEPQESPCVVGTRDLGLCGAGYARTALPDHAVHLDKMLHSFYLRRCSQSPADG